MTPQETARSWLADPLGVVLDFETTGWVGYAVEAAVLRATDGEVLLHTRLNPDVPIEAGAMAVHGIRQDDVADAPRWRDAEVDIAMALGGKNVIAWGAPFDRGVLGRELTRAGHSLRVIDWRCAMQLWRQHAGLKTTVKLEALVETADHSALGDCRAALEVVRRIAGAPCAELARTRLACEFRCTDCNKVVGPTVTSRGEPLPARCGRVL